MRSTQKQPMLPKVATRALDEVMRKIYYTLGICGDATHRRAVLIEIPYLPEESDQSDARLEEFEGVQLVGEGRAMASLEMAIQCK